MVKLADNATILSQTLTNGFGQVVAEGAANTSDALYTRDEYNAKGQLVKQCQDTGSGSTPTAVRTYTSGGMTLVQTDGRGNATTTVTDAAGNTTVTSYDANHDQPARVTDAQGHTSCYRCDHRGRKAAEWGTGIQPAVFAYDEADRLTALTTFQAEAGDISADLGERTDGDTTTWTYHDATGLETLKTYADGSSVSKTYDTYNRLHI